MRWPQGQIQQETNGRPNTCLPENGIKARHPKKGPKYFPCSGHSRMVQVFFWLEIEHRVPLMAPARREIRRPRQLSEENPEVQSNNFGVPPAQGLKLFDTLFRDNAIYRGLRVRRQSQAVLIRTAHLLNAGAGRKHRQNKFKKVH